jgi:hypothetical protein
MDVLAINTTVRSLIEDSNIDYADDAYLQAPLNLCYAELTNKLRLCNPDFDEYTIELPNVTAGTPDLSGFMTTGQPLQYLIEPISVEWKLPGQDPVYYRSAEKLSKIRDILIPGISAIDCWTWMHLTIFLSRFNVNLDIRVTGEFMFPPLVANSDTLLVQTNLLPAMAYAIASLIGSKRGNPPWVKDYGDRAQENFDTVNIAMCKGRQGKTERVGRMDRRRRRRGPGGNGIG